MSETPEATPVHRPFAAWPRFEAKVLSTNPGECWIWIGSTDGSGHGQYCLPRNGAKSSPKVPAHRFAYQQLVGPIPDGLEPDHTCRTPGCVNPEHIEPVTHRENMHRSPTLRRNLAMGPASFAARTKCARGHQYDEQNTGRRANGHRYCRACARIRMQKHSRKVAA